MKYKLHQLPNDKLNECNFPITQKTFRNKFVLSSSSNTMRTILEDFEIRRGVEVPLRSQMPTGLTADHINIYYNQNCVRNGLTFPTLFLIAVSNP